ncbi:MAG: hypothetical protein RL026_2088 [Pseudomonadota bacterium]
MDREQPGDTNCMTSDPSRPPPVPALVLTGGGARAAYQVGVLKALAAALPKARNPFPVIVGTSAGAVSAAILASRAAAWQSAVADIEAVWAGFRVGHVFRVGARPMLGAGLRWFGSLLTAGLLPAPPSLFDNAPLRALLARNVHWQGIPDNIASGDLRAVALCATGYQNARSVAFFDGQTSCQTWMRRRHEGRRTTLGLHHLMSSLALPFLFPAERIEAEFHGDGAMRQFAPLSPAAHLGGNRLLVIGVRETSVPPDRAEVPGNSIPRPPGPPDRAVVPANLAPRPPGPGQILGHALDSLFMDQVQEDLEQMQRTNLLLRCAPETVPGAHPVDTLLMAPSEDPGELAARHLRSLPRSLAALLRITGAGGKRGARLASYLMFEGAYTRELIALGERDANRRRDELLDFVAPGH